MLERQGERAKTSMSPEAVAQIPLPVFTEQVVNGMVLGYRVNAPLLFERKNGSRFRRNE